MKRLFPVKAPRGLLAVLVVLTCVLSLTGVRWGIPSQARADLVFSDARRDAAFFQMMKTTRDEIYSAAKGSPIGRVREPDDSRTPVTKAIGLEAGQNLRFLGETPLLAHFVRPFLLRTYHPDEQMTLASLAAMHPENFDFNPRLFQYGGAYIYGIGAYLGILHTFGIITATADLTYFLRNPSAMGNVVTAGRVFNALFAVFGVLALYAAGKELYSPRTGIIASFLLSLSPVLVFQSHIMKPYVMANFFFLACLFFSVRIFKTTASPRTYIYAGAAAGLTTGSMPVYAFVCAVPVMAHVTSGNRAYRRLLAALFSAAIVFLLTNPYWLTHCADATWELGGTKNMYAASWSPGAYVSALLLQFPLLASWPLSAGMAFGLLAGYFRKDPAMPLFAAAGIFPLLIFAYLLQHQPFSVHTTRFLLPWFGALLLPFARRIDLFCDGTRKIRTIALTFLFAVGAFTALCSAAVLSCLVNDASSRSTRSLAGQWISEHIPAGQTIGTFCMPEPTHTPPFLFENYRLLVVASPPDIAELPPYFVLVHNFRPATADVLRHYELLQTFEHRTFLNRFYYFGYAHPCPKVSILRRKPVPAR